MSQTNNARLLMRPLFQRVFAPTHRAASAARLLASTFAVAALSMGAACERVDFYDVVKTPVEDCDILPQGEFCGDVGGPSVEKFGVEIRAESTVLYFGEETWVATGIEGERVVIKEDRATREPGPCTTSSKRTLRFDTGNVDGVAVFTGTLEQSTRIEGPDACGDTPRGTRIFYNLAGERSERF